MYVSFSDIFENGDVYSNYVQKLSFKMMGIKIVAMNELLLRLIFIGNVSNIIAVRVEMPSFPITDIFRSKNQKPDETAKNVQNNPHGGTGVELFKKLKFCLK